MGASWVEYWIQVYEKDIVDAGSAKKVAVQVHEPFADAQFASDEEKFRTRLDGEGARILFARAIEGPFGQVTGSVTLPAHGHVESICASL